MQDDRRCFYLFIFYEHCFTSIMNSFHEMSDFELIFFLHVSNGSTKF